jgi:hypothetical protein
MASMAPDAKLHKSTCETVLSPSWYTVKSCATQNLVSLSLGIKDA